MSQLSTVADKLFAEIGIEDAFIQHLEALEQFNSAKVPGGGGAWSKGHRRVRSFRVVISTDKKTAEGHGDTLIDALRDAFQRLGMPEPQWVAATASFEQGSQLWGGKNLIPGSPAVYPPGYKRETLGEPAKR